MSNWKSGELDTLGNATELSISTLRPAVPAWVVRAGDDIYVRSYKGAEGARDNGLTETELTEAITHLAFYAGWPRAMSAMTVAKQVLGDGQHD